MGSEPASVLLLELQEKSIFKSIILCYKEAFCGVDARLVALVLAKRNDKYCRTIEMKR